MAGWPRDCREPEFARIGSTRAVVPIARNGRGDLSGGSEEPIRCVHRQNRQSKTVRSWNTAGRTAPLYCVGTGKAILAADYTRLRDQIAKELTRYTDRTLTDINDLDADIALTKTRGYAYDKGECRDRIVNFGAAITLPGGQPIVALGISLPDISLPDMRAERLGR